MKVTDLIKANGKTGFSFEVLPPLKGKGMINKEFRMVAPFLKWPEH